MTEVVYQQETGDPVIVQLRDPYWAAFIGWLFPGAGHFYQRRYAKGFLFMICVLSIFFLGLGLGRGRVVYASFKGGDFRWQYVCQLGVGAPALPAIAQAFKTKKGDPFFVLCERYPENSMGPGGVKLDFAQLDPEIPVPNGGQTYKDGFMAPPAGPIYQNERDVLGMWHAEMRHKFEIGTLYTVIAGLLNLLAVYDAFAGPSILTIEQKAELEEKRKKKKGND